jgi:SOS-response transcriptional repressor LexA
MDTLENAYQCLKFPGDGDLSLPLRLLSGRMLAAAEAGKKAETQSWMQELKLTAERLAPASFDGGLAGSPEKAQVRLECARAALLVSDADAATQELEDAIRLLRKVSADNLPGLHQRAQARWMLATLLVTLPDQRPEALVAMHQAHDDFTRLVVYASPGNPGWSPSSASADWYRDRCAEMLQGIERLVKTGSLSVPPPAPPPGPAKRPPFKWPISTLYAGNLTSLPVVGRIPAGGFGPTGADAHASETLRLQPSLDEFNIAGVPHCLVNLRGSPGITQLVSTNTYFILQVTGDSMDADHIDKGEYVLLRQQSNADNMDIVAAEMVGIDPAATLKRFLRKDGEIILEPRSNNTAHTPFSFKDGDRRFHIRGVVLGVFKQAP